MKNIQMFDMKKQYKQVKDKVDKKVIEVLESGYYVGGPEVKAFEEKCANFIGVKHAIGCANGTDALQIAMMAMGIGVGDEVITTPFTFIATAETIKILGAIPVFVDVEEDTYNIDPSKIEAAITKKTKAIIPVHLYGQVADMDSINEIAKKHKLFVIEDNAQGIGAKYKTKMAGSLSDFSTVSFYPAKNLGAAGDGGLMLTNDDKLADLARQIANHGQKVRYKHGIIGVNSRLDAIQAGILSIKLDYLNIWNKERHRIAKIYKDKLKEVSIVPHEKKHNFHIYHQFSIQIKNRDELQKFLADKGIPSAIHYPIPLHLQEAFVDLNLPKGTFPISEKISDNIISLPMHPELTEAEIKYITNTIIEFSEK